MTAVDPDDHRVTVGDRWWAIASWQHGVELRPQTKVTGGTAESSRIRLTTDSGDTVDADAMGVQAGRNLAGAHEPYDHTPYFHFELFGNRYEAVGTLDASANLVQTWADSGADQEDDRKRGVVYYLDDHGGVAGVLLWNVDEQTDRPREVIKKSRQDKLDREQLINAIPLG